jgi:hypothetical protein
MGKVQKMITRCCPACSKRHAQLVNVNCPVCKGFGTVTLGAAALSLHEPATVATAVEIAIEAAARTIDNTLTLSDDRHAPLRNVMTMLCDSGIVDHPGTRKTAHKPRHLRLVTDDTAAVEAAASYIPTVTPRDAVLALAPAYVYAEHERPNARGLPILSAAGHPSHMARITDPMTPGNDTAETGRQRRQQARSATILVAAAPKVITIKARAAAKAAQKIAA